MNVLNKTYATSTADMQVYYSPEVIARFCVLLFYYDQTVTGSHKNPDLSSVTDDFIVEAIEAQETIYSYVKKYSDDDDNEKSPLPELKGSINWIEFRDKFKLQLSLIKSKRVPRIYSMSVTRKKIYN